MSKITADECQKCGACCGPCEASDYYVYVSRRDRKRIPKSLRSDLHSEDTGGEITFWLKTKEGVNGVTCVALEGRIGEKVGCTIYERRPGVCRAFKPGSMPCLDARNHVFGDGSVLYNWGP